ncbi:hypothetical protein DY000_02016339 [Brassica cretica]|uniref:Uncharacterized protein n=1 Tax=Brassica cretica TaxID=69181 RepID=A0ABQ7D7S0_BRACR|nr:hypothetical protein DY000_02016339 [Brassica cretica]
MLLWSSTSCLACDGFDSCHGANHRGIRLMNMWSGSVDNGVNVVSDEVFCCTWCCDVGADVVCGGVVHCVVVIKLCGGVDVLVGILGDSEDEDEIEENEDENKEEGEQEQEDGGRKKKKKVVTK